MINLKISLTYFLRCMLIPALLTPIAGIAQTKFDNPKKTIKNEFWGQIYNNGGQTFYCKKKFDHKNMVITASYVLTDESIRNSLNCGARYECKSDSKVYNYIMSDLHNMVPTETRIAMKMQHAIFDDMDPGVDPEECGFKRSFDRYEPDNSIKGDIARILAYMKTTYHLSTGISVQIIKEWNKIDPVSDEERKRDALIKKIQGNSNPYVVDPSKINLLKDDNL